ncbi:Hypothetical protein MVR_LOCUS76 [uncultured virus]|nr:Hypothetical protein MVR_LOCUS76 [uncultured virus]
MSTITVTSTTDDNSVGTFRSAINLLNSSLATTIDFAAPNMSIVLTSPLPIITRPVTIDGTNATISGNSLYIVLQSTADITLNQFNITEGSNTNDVAGIKLTNSTAVFNDTTVTNCISVYNDETAIGGAGVLLINSQLTLNSLTADGSTAITGNSMVELPSFGSGICAISNSSVSSNPATNRIDIANNTAEFTSGSLVADKYVGIGIYISTGLLNLINCNISFNTSSTTVLFDSLSGGLHVEGLASCTLTNCVIGNNTSKANAGMYILNTPDVLLVDTLVNQNASTDIAGGIGCDGSAIVLESTSPQSTAITNNAAYGNGAGMYLVNGSRLSSSASAIEVLIQGNTNSSPVAVAVLGGGIYASDSLIELDNFTIDTNGSSLAPTGNVDGGGIYAIGNGVNSYIANSRITSNTGRLGSGVTLLIAGDVTVTYTTFDGNMTSNVLTGSGGGLYCNSDLLYDGLVITNNQSGNGGGIRFVNRIGGTNIRPIIGASVASVISGNMARQSGGGINSTASQCVFDNITIQGNSVTLGVGGGIICSTNTIVTVSNCLIDSNTCTGNGGGISLAASGAASFIVSNCIISNNIATNNGGGMHTANVGVIDTVINNNRANVNGGGVYMDLETTISYSTFPVSPTIFANSAGSEGGGIYQDGQVSSITNAIISANDAADGGNVTVFQGTLNVTTSIIQNGTANSLMVTASGGVHVLPLGIFNTTYVGIISNSRNGIANGGTTNLNNSNVAFSGNNGVSNLAGSVLTVINTTIGNNGVNGILDVTVTSTTSLVNATIARNINGINASSTTPVSITNTIVALNTSFDTIGTFASAGFNLIQNPGTATGFIASDIIGVDPLLDTYDNNGGITQTMALLNLSPAYEAGNTAAAIGPFDQRGPGFLRVVNSAVDIGAYESQFVICFSGDSMLLVKEINSNQVLELPASQVTSTNHLVYNCKTDTYDPIVYNIVTYNCNRFVKLTSQHISSITRDTYITGGHYIMYEDRNIKASQVPDAQIEKLEYQNVYSICLGKSGYVIINGLPVKAYGLDEWQRYCITKKLMWHNNSITLDTTEAD